MLPSCGRQVARRLPEDEVVQRKVLALGPHERELDHARLLIFELADCVDRCSRAVYQAARCMKGDLRISPFDLPKK